MVTATTSKKVRQSSGRRKKSASIRTYDAAMRYITSHTDYEQMLRVRYNRDTFNLDRMIDLLDGLGNPHETIRAVHIAGTKGKGSTATMLAAMLSACGYKVGLYTSPHVCDIRERIRIDGTVVTQAAMTKLINRVVPDRKSVV